MPKGKPLLQDRFDHSVVSTDTSFGLAAKFVDVSTTDVGIDLTIADHEGLVVIKQSDNETQVAEAGSGADPSSRLANEDSYEVVLSDKPEPGQPVTLTVSHDSQVVVNTGDDWETPTTIVTFDDTNWNVPQSVRVRAVLDTTLESTHYSRITHTISSDDLKFANSFAQSVDVEILDNAPGVLVRETGGSTDVLEKTTDFEIGRGQVTNPGTGQGHGIRRQLRSIVPERSRRQRLGVCRPGSGRGRLEQAFPSGNLLLV